MQSIEPPKAYVGALKFLLRPLVRGLIAHGMTFPHFCTLLKSVFVDVAGEFTVEGKRLTDSRVSLITGVHRKDVKRLRETPRDAIVRSPYVTIGAQVAGHWTGRAPYLDDAGAPRALPRSGPVSFDSLVESISKDLRSRTLLDEWLRQGMVTLDDGLVRLNTQSFIPNRGFDDLAYYYGRNLHDHIAAATHNLEGGTPPFLERSTYYDGLTPRSVADLEARARAIGMDALVKMNREALHLARKDDGNPDATLRMNFGVYFFKSEKDAPMDKDDKE
ncbi:hypothetical protein EDD55_10663 [Varunaivibrio sulfuroxidans]|uniref:Uncharacterized protein n=1 Tax=Varunaivibrio sulfuroxidans TaxID=1773489 RepID=A0A4R3J8E1_9PROT|nr:hypothetical protein EDD55_10663 [Varunaivibrio sulfuroxidans]